MTNDPNKTPSAAPAADPAEVTDDGLEATPADATAALVEADPQEQALDALVEVLEKAGITAGDAETLQALEAGLDDEAETPPKEKERAAARTHVAARRRARNADADEGLGSSETAEGELEIRVAEDRMSATITRLDDSATLRRVGQALQRAQVRYGITVDAVKTMVARARAGEVLTDVLVARGDPATPGIDAHFEWEIETAGRAGTVLDDGSIDLRDRKLITVVQEGQLLGRMRPAQEGSKGRDVFGRALVPAPVTALRLVPGAHVRTEDEGEEVTACYAEAEGGVAQEEAEQKGQRRLKLWLTKVSRIEQDVDYATGHVEFDGEVVITGSVKALFRVHASGSVTIEGNVEAGARIEAGGDLMIGGGVVGEETELIAGGKVMAKFLQGCHVRAGGDMEIGAYVFEASVRCSGRLTVAGMGEGSGRALVGGLVWAGRGVESPSLGSPSNPKIRLILGVDPAAVDEADKFRSRVRSAEERRKQLLSDLGLERFDAARIKALLKAPAEPDVRAQRVQQVKELSRIGAAIKHGRQRLSELMEAQQAPAREADLVVTGTVFPGAELRIGECTLRIGEESRARRYRLVEEDGDVTIHEQEA